MANLQGEKKWSPVRVLETNELARGGLNGNMNEQAKALLDRTEWLNDQKASKSEIIQGHFGFNTLAEFNAKKATLPINSTITIAEAGANQGENIWDGSTLTKSPYDPFMRAQAYADLNPLFKPVVLIAGTDVATLGVGIYYITTIAVAESLINMPPGTTPMLGTIIVYRSGGVAYQRWIRYALNEQWEHTGNGGGINFAWNAWEKLVKASDIATGKSEAIISANLNTAVTTGYINSALMNALERPNLFSENQVKMTVLPTSQHASNIEKVSIYGKYAAKITANSGGAYPLNAGAQWSFDKNAADFPSGFLSAQITIDTANAGTGGYISVIQRDAGGATLANSYLTATTFPSAISESTTYYLTGVAVNPSVASIQLYMRLDGSDRTFTVSKPMLCDGKSAFWRNPASTVSASLSLNLFPSPALTAQGSAMYQATHTLEDGYDVTIMNPNAVTQIFYELAIGGIWRVGDTVTFTTDVFTDVLNTGGTTSADISIICLDVGGATLGGIQSASSAAMSVWNTITTSKVIPAGTAKIRLRYVHRNKGQLSKFRKSKLVTSNPDAMILTASSFSVGGSGTSLVYVAPTGNDANDGKSASSPFATFTKALTEIGNNGIIELAGGEYRQTMPIAANGHVIVRSALRQRAVILGSDQLVVTKTSGFSQVYHASLAVKPTGMGGVRGQPVIFEWGTPSKPIATDDRHFLQRGRTHRLPYTEMFEAATKAELDTVGGRGKWFWESGVIYFAATDGGDATAKRYETRVRNTITHANGSVHFSRIDCYFSSGYGFGCGGISTLREDCRAFGSFHNGFADEANFTRSYRDEAGGNGNDGFNGTVTVYAGTADEATRVEGVYFDPYSHDNGDDGISYHVRGDATIYGGAFEYNTKADVVHVTGAACSCYNTLAQGTKYGFYTATPPNDGRTYTSMRCVGTRARKNEISYFAAGGSQLSCENTAAENPTLWGYSTDSTAGSVISAKNCKYTGDAAKAKSGNVIVTNDTALT